MGLPAYQSKTTQATGSLIASITNDLLLQWKCQDSIVAMAFDSTTSYTGHTNAACISRHQVTGKAFI